MTSSNLTGNKKPPLPAPPGRLRMLIITDSDERLIKLRAALNTGEVEIACAASPEEMCSGCSGGHDLVVVDVCPASLYGLLKTLRDCPGCTKIPVLVEADRLTANTKLAGVLPKYRAMPCGHTDLVTLARQIITPTGQEPERRGLF